MRDLPTLDLSDVVQQQISALGARIVPRYPWWLRPFVGRGVIAVTLGRRIYLSADFVRRRAGEAEGLLRHELVHVEQVARLGVLRFVIRYLREYVALRRQGLRHFEAYRRISFEVEAFAAEEAYNQRFGRAD
jgi:hypothetical protein